MQENPPLRAVLINSWMQLTLHATRPKPQGASRLVQAMTAWSVKTRHAPSRHCRDARVYDHTATAMHEYTPPLCVFSPLLPSEAGGAEGVRRRTSYLQVFHEKGQHLGGGEQVGALYVCSSAERRENRPIIEKKNLRGDILYHVRT